MSIVQPNSLFKNDDDNVYLTLPTGWTNAVIDKPVFTGEFLYLSPNKGTSCKVVGVNGLVVRVSDL